MSSWGMESTKLLQMITTLAKSWKQKLIYIRISLLSFTCIIMMSILAYFCYIGTVMSQYIEIL